jgi:hypothetical protein
VGKAGKSSLPMIHSASSMKFYAVWVMEFKITET